MTNFNLNFQGETLNDVFPTILENLLHFGHESSSRNGKVKELAMARIHLTNPSANPYMVVPGRRVSLPAQIAETIWVLSGRDDIKFIAPYLPRAKDFSDDGVTWRGAYGPRIRAWQTGEESIDQLYNVAYLLHTEPDTRRAVIQIFDPSIDDGGKDVPCNNWISFIVRDGMVHAHVAVRSNDAFWGLSGINSFEWTFLLQAVAFLSGHDAGSLTFSTTSLHLYEQHWERAENIWVGRAQPKLAEPREKYLPQTQLNVEGLRLLAANDLPDFSSRWRVLRDDLGTMSSSIDLIRKHKEATAKVGNPALVDRDDRLLLQTLRAWHQSLEFKLFANWLGVLIEKAGIDTATLEDGLANDALHFSKIESPGFTPFVAQAHQALCAPAEPVAVDRKAAFINFVDELHMEKNAAYGDSWMRRGEMLGIMANVARKVDRLGLPGAGDNELDTDVDLLLYLIKYKTWVEVQMGYRTSDGLLGDAHHAVVMSTLRSAMAKPWDRADDHIDLIATIRSEFEALATQVESGAGAKFRARRTERLIVLALALARKEFLKADLATKQFTGYDIP